MNSVIAINYFSRFYQGTDGIQGVVCWIGRHKVASSVIGCLAVLYFVVIVAKLRCFLLTYPLGTFERHP